MSHRRKNSVRDKVMGKKWIYSERNTHSTDRVWAISKGESSLKIWLVIMGWVIFFFFFLAALGLRCCTRAFSSCGERELLFIVVRGLLTVVASLVVEHSF